MHPELTVGRRAGFAAAAPGFPAGSFGIGCDVSSPEQVSAAFARIGDQPGSISVLHNNAGVSFNGRGDAPADELELEMWNRIIAINQTGTFLGTKHALPLLLVGGRGGSVINMASIAGPWVGTVNTACVASKGGIVAMTKSLAVTQGPRGIRAKRHLPRFDGHQNGHPSQIRPAQFAQFVGQVPLGRQGATGDIEGLVVYLASDSSSYFSGNIMTLDGALTLV